MHYFSPCATKKRKESREVDEEFAEDDVASKGCGRLICKGCCEESWQRYVTPHFISIIILTHMQWLEYMS